MFYFKEHQLAKHQKNLNMIFHAFVNAVNEHVRTCMAVLLLDFFSLCQISLHEPNQGEILVSCKNLCVNPLYIIYTVKYVQTNQIKRMKQLMKTFFKNDCC